MVEEATLNGSAEAALQLRKFENILLRLDGSSAGYDDGKPLAEIASQAINSTLKVDNREKFSTPQSLISEPSKKYKYSKCRPK